ncbi:MBL fold metallo-hydrolase [Maritimibacter sp. UBA3975]|uniref:MBL fold metallo-hydrolase n=1 Tax=Maritimibacter sp. UBA3975 TaxID=1946833 RepID=UPI000C0AAB45|nr:MBL fold metallo-hydrolase [Maritimibacter sp. UBA3975]MAM61111.1 MBL fold metallo-hydrolase [Maritimibacter sp.]|tara:strand:+ start:977 stop:1888 length:912 start_codon:yes stop_codon:yes gene_type:complete
MDLPDDMPAHGEMVTLEPGIRRIIARNPSPMTYWGTNTFVLGEGAVTVVDPGPDLPDHMTALLAGLAPGETVAQIFVTHSHLDHSPLARRLSAKTGAPVFAFGDATAGRSQVMSDLVAQGMPAGGEGVDRAFEPDVVLADGDEVDIGGGRKVEAIWTPGHYSNHLSFAIGDAVLVGDHVMAWASSLVSPPDGDLTAFMGSCEKLLARDDRIHYPAHGPAIEDPKARLAWLMDHRKGRERAILEALAEGPATVPTLTRTIYTDTPDTLIPAAERNVFAHLIDLATRGAVTASPKLAPDARFARA